VDTLKEKICGFSRMMNDQFLISLAKVIGTIFSFNLRLKPQLCWAFYPLAEASGNLDQQSERASVARLAAFRRCKPGALASMMLSPPFQ
jgi:hypothetical protein